MSLSNNFPTIAPSLNLDFANVKALDPRITFTRTTTATYYDGVTTAKAEENLLLQSQDFTTSWINGNTTDTADTETAPDGTATADTITDDATNGVHQIWQTPSFSINTTYAYSCFLKAGTSNYAALQIWDAATSQRYIVADFDLSGGTVRTSGAGTSATLTSSSITSVGSGWYRCSIIGQLAAAGTIRVGVAVSDGTTSPNTFGSIVYAGTGSTIYAWGAQLEQRSAVSSYTPTTTQPITNYIPVLQTAASGVARFDHNPTTGESLGLLVEEQRTNLLLQSEDLGTTWNLGSGTLTANAWVPPSGSLTGDIFTLPADSTVPAQNVTVANSTTYTLSFYFNKSLTTAAFFRLRFTLAGGISVSAFIDVANLSFGTMGSGLASGEIINVGNGVYRAWVTMTYGASDAGARGIAISGTTTNNSSTPDTGKNIAIWGIQYEQAAFPTSYIATTSATVTRNADAASMTGTNFSSWYRADEGTLYVETLMNYTPAASTFPAAFELNNGTINNRIQIAFNSSRTLRGQVAVNGTFTTLATANTYTVGSPAKTVMSYKQLDHAAVGNGGTVVTNTSVVVPQGINTAIIGDQSGGGALINGTIKKIAYYPSRLSNAQLQALTS